MSDSGSRFDDFGLEWLFPEERYTVRYRYERLGWHEDPLEFFDRETAVQFAEVEQLLTDICYERLGSTIFRIVEFELVRIPRGPVQ